MRTSSLPLFVPLVPSFRAPRVLPVTPSLGPPGLVFTLDEPAAELATVVCWSCFCSATFCSFSLRRRVAGTHSSHLWGSHQRKGQRGRRVPFSSGGSRLFPAFVMYKVVLASHRCWGVCLIEDYGFENLGFIDQRAMVT